MRKISHFVVYIAITFYKNQRIKIHCQTLNGYHGFLGNTQAPDDQECTERLLQAYADIGCRMSVGDERGEMFYQDITKIERKASVNLP